VARLTGDGTVTEFTGGVTSGFTASRGPGAITAGPDGNIWFTEAYGPGAVGRFNSNGTVTEFTGGVTSGFTASKEPLWIAPGPDGNVWFSEYLDPGAVARLNGDGTVTEFTGGGTSGFTANRGPYGITTGPDGNIWFTEDKAPGAVGRLNSNGTVTEFIGGVTSGFTTNRLPRQITTGPDGNLWFTEGNSPGALARVNGNGTVTELAGGVTPGFTAGRGPLGITTGPDGNVWFTESFNPGAVARLNGDGTVSEFTGGVTPGLTADRPPGGITTGPDGNIWFTEGTSPGAVGRIAPRTPGVVTGAAGGIRAESGTLTGSVNADGLAVSDCRFEYGASTAYGASVPCAQAVGGGTGTVSVSADVGGLQPSTAYHFRLAASNAAATNVGGDQMFTAKSAPVVVTGAASSIGASFATLTGSVNPNGETVTDCHFEYGTSTGYGASVPCAQAVGGASSPVAVSANLGGLQPGTAYHFQLVASTAFATRRGSDQTLATGPVVVTGVATGIGAGAATLAGSVNPYGSPVTDCHFEYGTSTAYGASAPCAQQVGGGTSQVAVSANVSGLARATTYHFRLAATNAIATVQGSDQTLTTAALGGGGGRGNIAIAAVGTETIVPSAFKAAPSGRSAIAAARLRYGAKVTYTLNEPASVRFTVAQREPGRRTKRGTCTGPTSGNRKASRCTRLVLLRGSFTVTSHPGTNAFRFTGRLAGHKLAPGGYRLIGTPTANRRAGQSDSAGFQIVPPARIAAAASRRSPDRYSFNWLSLPRWPAW
jgi:streptogramin lyase